MTMQNPAPRVTAYADAILHSIRFSSHPYMEALADGSMTLDNFRLTQEQFSFAVAFFPRPMAALVGRISQPQQRLGLLRNLVEEHGCFEEPAFHIHTFREFLRSLGSVRNQDEKRIAWPSLRAFNSILLAACVLDELATGIACMGMIEHMFAEVSTRIGRAVIDRGWVEADQLVHYTRHAEIDVGHAQDFFVIIESDWADKSRRAMIKQGIELGAYAFDRLYLDLASGEDRRFMELD